MDSRCFGSRCARIARAAIGVLPAVDRVDADPKNEVGGVAALNAEQEPADGDRGHQALGELLTRERLAANGRLARVAAGGADIAVGFAASDRRVLAPRLMPTSSGYEQISDETSMNTGRSAQRTLISLSRVCRFQESGWWSHRRTGPARCWADPHSRSQPAGACSHRSIRKRRSSFFLAAKACDSFWGHRSASS